MASTEFLMLAARAAARTDREVSAGRYEFRVWPRDMPEAAAILQRSWPLIGAERRSDIYLLTGSSAVRLVKLRAGNRLETKRRDHDLGPLQHWTHHPYPMFPLARADLRAVAEDLGTPRLAPDAGLSPGHLVAHLGERAPGIRPLTLRKSRLVFRKQSCRAEICHVAAAGWGRLTLAIEDPDPESALGVLQALRIGHLHNRSYGDVLCRRRLASLPAPRHLAD